MEVAKQQVRYGVGHLFSLKGATRLVRRRKIKFDPIDYVRFWPTADIVALI